MCMYVCAKLLQPCLTPCDPTDCSPPGSSVHGCSRQEYWSGLPFPPADLPYPGIEPESTAPPALAGGFFATEPPGKSSLRYPFGVCGRHQL